jgi:hypothetical protein
MSNTTTPHHLTIEQLGAIQEYAALNGARWKMKLGLLWQSGKDTGLLRQLRNEFGPAWLQKFKLAAHTDTVVVKLTESHRDFHDYDVIGAPFNRVCVAREIASGAHFNAFMDAGRKTRLKWHGSIEETMAKALSLKSNQIIVRTSYELPFNEAVALLGESKSIHTFTGGSFWAGADMDRETLIERMHKAAALEISPVCNVFEHYLAIIGYGQKTLYVETQTGQAQKLGLS